MQKFLDFLTKEEGEVAIEYGMIACFIIVLIIGTIHSIGVNLNALFLLKLISGFA